MRVWSRICVEVHDRRATRVGDQACERIAVCPRRRTGGVKGCAQRDYDRSAPREAANSVPP